VCGGSTHKHAQTTLSVLRNDAVGTAGAPTGAALVEAANLAVAKLKEHERALAAGSKPRSYRRLKDALADAKDGDRILMLRGIHNFSGETCEVKKRVLIKVRSQLLNLLATAHRLWYNARRPACNSRTCFAAGVRQKQSATRRSGVP
jgi:hypothetical protein